MQDQIVDERAGRVEDLYRREHARIWRALYAFSSDPEIASDALAEAVARALRDEARIDDLAAWTWRVAFRVAAAELRRRRRPVPPSGPATYELPDPVPELVTALRRLSPKQRMAILLHDYADRPTAEVAATLGCARATVHVHLSQGRRRLRRFLEATDA
jgi:RNA polymerase sigma-70 factor (ECF subfamily)